MSLAPITIIPTHEEEARAAEQGAMQALSTAKIVRVETDDDYREAGAHFATIKGMLKTLEARRVAITGPINASLKLINDGFKRPKETLEAALTFYERPMLAFKQAEARKIREAEEAARLEREKLKTEARAIAMAEEWKLQKARAEALEAERKAAALADGGDAFDVLMAEEAAAEAREREAAAQRATEDAIRAAAKVEVIAEFVPKASAAGTSFRKNWKWRVVDAALIPRGYLIPDESSIGLYARTEKENAAIPGIEFYCEEKIGG